MVLNSKTRDLVKEGTVLYDKNSSYVVTTIMDVYFANRIVGKDITVKIIKHPDRYWEGHNVYLQPMSSYYGLNFED